jgi:hypothetical protein
MDTPECDWWCAGGGGKASARLVWFQRWKFFARAARLGYNLMSVDADLIFHRYGSHQWLITRREQVLVLA